MSVFQAVWELETRIYSLATRCSLSSQDPEIGTKLVFFQKILTIVNWKRQNNRKEDLENDETWCQSHQHFRHVFFVRKFVQSQNVTRKKAFVHKICTFNIDEIDHWKKILALLMWATSTISSISLLFGYFDKNYILNVKM